MNARLAAACAAINEDPAEYVSGGAWDAFGGCDDLADRVGLDVAELRAGLREYFLTQMSESELLGVIFAHMVSEELDREKEREQIAAIVSGDAAPDDFMDANMVMDRAWRMVGCSAIDFNSEDGDGMTQEQANLWNAAYSHGLEVMEGF